MRTLAPGLQSHLNSGVTTLCHCWKLETRDGDVMGFTDHDRDLSFDGVGFEAQAGFTATDVESSLGLSVDNLEASGALTSERLNEQRLLSGDFDNAAIEVWLVNWQDVSQRSLLRRGNLGEITRGRSAFSAELRGMAHVLNQPQGRIFQYGCDTVVGDGRCGVDLDDPAYSIEASVVWAEGNRRLLVSGAESFAEGWFARGTIEFVSGANMARKGEIKLHRLQQSGAMIELWQPMAMPVGPGDGAILRAGCDKQYSTCKAKFANTVNFRGFPHIPGDDFLLSYARRDDDGNDGASRNAFPGGSS